jgi:branched-chain amino acid transport system substrate-binding protein
MRLQSIAARLIASAAIGASVLTALSFSPPADAATKAAIVLGDICSCTGPEASSVGQTAPTLQAWAKWVNAHGGIQGHPVTLIVKDDAYNPGTSLSDAEALVTQNHVAAIFDESDADTAWASYVEQHHVPVLGGQVNIEGYTSSDWFVAGATYDSFTNAFAAVAKQQGIKKLADVYCAEAPVCAQSVVPLRTSMAKAGIDLVYTQSISFSAPSYAAPCLAAKQAGATGLVVGDATAIVTKVVADCATQNYTPKEITGDGTVGLSFLDVPQFEGMAAIQENIPWFVHNSVTKPFYTALNKYAPGVTTSPNFGEIAIEAWADGVLLQEAGNAAHLTSAAPTAAQILAGLYAVPHGTTLGGLSAPLTFKKGQVNLNPCYFTMSIKNGKFVQTNGGKVTCAKT